MRLCSIGAALQQEVQLRSEISGQLTMMLWQRGLAPGRSSTKTPNRKWVLSFAGPTAQNLPELRDIDPGYQPAVYYKSGVDLAI